MWSAAHHRQPSFAHTPELALLISRWMHLPERLLQGSLPGLNFWTCITGQCKPNFALFLMKSLPSCQIPPFSATPGQRWHKHANDIHLPDAQTGPQTCGGARKFKDSFKIIFTIHAKIMNTLVSQLYISCRRSKVVTQIPRNKRIESVHPIFQLILNRASHH